MKVKVLCYILIILLSMQCSSFREIRALKNCEFCLESADHFSLAGVNLSGASSLQNLGFINSTKIMEAGGRGTLITEFVLRIGAKNPNSTKAAINKLEYVAYLDGNEMIRGNLDQRFEIPANGTTTIPLNIKTDLFLILKKQSIQSIINLALNLAGEGQTSSHLGIKIKPSIGIGKKFVNYPGYITLNREFKSE